MDLLVVSREDLSASTESGSPRAQLDALRAAFGPGPLLALTDGLAGAHLDLLGSRMVVPATQVIRDVPTVGAGDAFAALLSVTLAHGPGPVDLAGAANAARAAAAGVAAMLVRRQRDSRHASG
jgi:sugar/nucleoside kinase (ribokinase family)